MAHISTCDRERAKMYEDISLVWENGRLVGLSPKLII